MNCLFLDLGSHHGSVACVTERAVASSRLVDHRLDDAAFMEMLKKVVDDAGWTWKDLDRIACVVGPGGFTSLRVAVAAANALADTLQIPLSSIHLSDLLRARSPEQDAWWLHSTKKTELFVCGFGVHASVMPEPTHVLLSQLPALKKGDRWMGELIPEHRSVIEEKGMEEVLLTELAAVLPSFLAGLPAERRILQPWYGREW